MDRGAEGQEDYREKISKVKKLLLFCRISIYFVFYYFASYYFVSFHFVSFVSRVSPYFTSM